MKLALLRIGLAAGVVTSPALPGCGGRRAAETGQQPRESGISWEVRSGSQGGFTGGSSGHTIQSDGTVLSWSRITPDDPLDMAEIGHASPEALRRLEEALLDPGLRALALHEYGNLTAFLEWRRNSETRRYTWPERMKGRAPLPEPLHRILEAFRAAVDSAH